MDLNINRKMLAGNMPGIGKLDIYFSKVSKGEKCVGYVNGPEGCGKMTAIRTISSHWGVEIILVTKTDLLTSKYSEKTKLFEIVMSKPEGNQVMVIKQLPEGVSRNPYEFRGELEAVLLNLPCSILFCDTSDKFVDKSAVFDYSYSNKNKIVLILFKAIAKKQFKGALRNASKILHINATRLHIARIVSESNGNLRQGMRKLLALGNKHNNAIEVDKHYSDEDVDVSDLVEYNCGFNNCQLSFSTSSSLLKHSQNYHMDDLKMGVEESPDHEDVEIADVDEKIDVQKKLISENASENRVGFKYSTEFEKSKVFVANVHVKATEEEIKEVFAKFGNVVSVRLMRHKNGQPKGVAFVVFDTEEGALETVKAENIMLKGLDLNVDLALSNPPAKDKKKPAEKVDDMAALNAPRRGHAGVLQFVPRFAKSTKQEEMDTSENGGCEASCSETNV